MARNKVILVLIDGLSYQTAVDCMGFLASLVAAKKAQLFKVESELPSMSRPLYETILTGTAPLEHGILHNHIVRLSNQESIFSIASKAGLKTASASYHWISELYNRFPFDPKVDRITHSPDSPIQAGVFYWQDHYPDSHLYADAEYLRTTYDPDFLLVHPMNVDDAGHKAGLDSSTYRNTARYNDIYLSEFLKKWMDDGYQIIVTSDHGMNDDKSHGGTLAVEREVPLYLIGTGFASTDESLVVKQTELCGLMCKLLGLDSADKSFPSQVLAN